MANYVNFFQSAILAPIIMAANVVNADVILKNSLNADLQWKPPTGYGGQKKLHFGVTKQFQPSSWFRRRAEIWLSCGCGHVGGPLKCLIQPQLGLELKLELRLERALQPRGTYFLPDRYLRIFSEGNLSL